MVSKKAIVGIAIAVIIIGFTGTIFLEANRLNVPPVVALGTIIGIGTGFGLCDTFSCHAVGTIIPNSCEIGSDTRTCTYQVNHPDPNTSFTISETDFAWTVSGTDTECFLQGDGFGGTIENPLLLCRDDARFEKNIWERTDSDTGTDLFITFTVIGDMTRGERFDFLCETLGSCAIA
jgi:hypothetical protein